MKILFALIILLSFSPMRSAAARVPAALDVWSLVVLIEKDVHGNAKVTIIKNEGEHIISDENLNQLKAAFADEVVQLKQEAIIHSMVFIDGKKISRTTKVPQEFASDLRKLLHGLEKLPARKQD
jgi:hypothetical protein